MYVAINTDTSSKLLFTVHKHFVYISNQYIFSCFDRGCIIATLNDRKGLLGRRLIELCDRKRFSSFLLKKSLICVSLLLIYVEL